MQDNAADTKTTPVSNDNLPSNIHILVGETMERDYLALVDALSSIFPDLRMKITGQFFTPKPTPVEEYVRKALPIVQFFAMALIVFRDRVWTSFLRFRNVPQWYHRLKPYGIRCCILLFFAIPKTLNLLFVQYPFEVYVDETLIYSKLETGRLPRADEIVAGFEKLQLVDSQRD